MYEADEVVQKVYVDEAGRIFYQPGMKGEEFLPFHLNREALDELILAEQQAGEA